MNFITSLPPSKYKSTVYNIIFIIINRFIKYYFLLLNR